MAVKKIKLTSGVIHSFKGITKTPLTTISCTSKFDQITAEAMGIKENIYDADGIMRHGVSEWKPDLEMFGSNVTFAPHQKDLFGDKPLNLGSIKLEIEKVLLQDADTSLKMKFKVTVPGYPRDLLDFCESVKKGECAVIIEKPSKSVEDDAKQRAINFGLFKEPKVESDDEPKGEDPAENDEDKTDPAAEDDAVAVGAGTLPSMAQMGGRPHIMEGKKRGRKPKVN